jgi:hypothetical protein
MGTLCQAKAVAFRHVSNGARRQPPPRALTFLPQSGKCQEGMGRVGAAVAETADLRGVRGWSGQGREKTRIGRQRGARAPCIVARETWACARHQEDGRGRSPRTLREPCTHHEKTAHRNPAERGAAQSQHRPGLRGLLLPLVLPQGLLPVQRVQPAVLSAELLLPAALLSAPLLPAAMLPGALLLGLLPAVLLRLLRPKLPQLPERLLHGPTACPC